MRKTGTGFTTQLTNSWKCWKTKKKPQKCGFIYLGSPNIAPRYAINKIKKISLGRFFKIFLIVYSRIRHAQRGLLWRIRLGHFSKIKKSGKTRFVYFGSPNRIRTGVLALKGRCPRPLDDRAKTAMFITERRQIIHVVCRLVKWLSMILFRFGFGICHRGSGVFDLGKDDFFAVGCNQC